MKNQSKPIFQKALLPLLFWMAAGILFFASVAVAQDQTVQVRDEVANVYSKPEKSASVIDTLKIGDEVGVLQSESGWNAIKLPDKRLGWTPQSAFAENSKPAESQPASATASSPAQQPKARLIVPSGRVRGGPSVKSGVRYGLKKGEIVTILKEENGWWQIQLEEGKTGWAHSRLFERLPGQAVLPQPAPGPQEPSSGVSGGASEEAAEPGDIFFQAVLKVNSGRVRKAPSLDAAILFNIKKNEQVTVMDRNGEWFQILADNGKGGWAHSSLFTQPMRRVLKDIRFVRLSDGKETVTFSLTSFNPPTTFASDENGVPEIVCDFLNTSLAKEIDKELDAEGGKLIKQIHTSLLKGTPMKIRVVTELDDSQKYNVKQIFYKKKNEYVLTVTPYAQSQAN